MHQEYNSTAIIGDVNHDGFPDLVRNGGRLFYGNGTDSLTNSGIDISSPANSSNISNKGVDTNGDGLLEWWGLNGSSANLKTYNGISFDTIAISDVAGLYNGRVGSGDFNGDGYEDVVSADYSFGYTHPFQGQINNAGAIWVFNGSNIGISGSSAADADWTVYGVYVEYLGYSIASLDVDGDGMDDLLLGSNGQSYLFYGSLQEYTDSSGNPRDARSFDADATFGHYHGVANAGDQNQDGYDDLMVGGASPSRSIYLFFGAPN